MFAVFITVITLSCGRSGFTVLADDGSERHLREVHGAYVTIQQSAFGTFGVFIYLPTIS